MGGDFALLLTSINIWWWKTATGKQWRGRRWSGGRVKGRAHVRGPPGTALGRQISGHKQRDVKRQVLGGSWFACLLKALENHLKASLWRRARRLEAPLTLWPIYPSIIDDVIVFYEQTPERFASAHAIVARLTIWLATNLATCQKTFIKKSSPFSATHTGG